MQIIFNKSELPKDKGIETFNSLFYSTVESVEISKCPLMTEQECDSDEFWKEVKCGVDLKSPAYLITVRTSKDYRKNYEVEGGSTVEFQIVIDVIKGILGFTEPVNILRQVDKINTVYKGSIFIGPGDPQEEDPSHIESISISSGDSIEDDFQVTMISIPRELNFNTRWNTIPSNLLDKFVELRINKVFN